MTKSEVKRKVIQVMVNHNGVDFEEEIMFTKLFNQYPHTIVMKDRFTGDGFKKFVLRMTQEFDLVPIYSTYYPTKATKNMNGISYGAFVDIKNKVLITVGGWDIGRIIFKLGDEETIKKYMEIGESFKKTVKKKQVKGKIYMLALKGSGQNQHLAFSPFTLQKTKLSIDKNYNDDFKEYDKIIKTELKKKDGNGIVILHGEAGTGKTHYVKHLCEVVGKKILYIPPSLVNYIVSPDFMKILSKHKNSVLVIEDADNVLRKRDDNVTTQEVSTLLNITDGMLHDVMGLQIVCTFNTDISNIDSAYLRKGRLIAQYEFKKLNKKKAQQLSNSLNFKTKIKEDMTLADIYNQDTPLMVEINEKKKIGFNNG